MTEREKTLYMIGLDGKERAVKLIEHYVEQPDFDFNHDNALKLLKEY